MKREISLPDPVSGPWTLKDLYRGKLGQPRHGLKVFSCFHCGGGSTMGYKLAGFDVLGGVEIDPDMMDIYRANHQPKHSHTMGVQAFNKIKSDDLPRELFNLDVLDGSPPCSSFSLSGDREKAWGKHKKFREGQCEQVLDDLFFHFIGTARKLRPRIVVAENVKGLIMKNARHYVKRIFAEFREAGYETQLFLLDASYMGVPQARERVFFLSRRRDLGLPPFDLRFSERAIPLREAFVGCEPENSKVPNEKMRGYWARTLPGDAFTKLDPKFKEKGWGSYFNWAKLDPSLPCRTMQAYSDPLLHWAECRSLWKSELVRIQSFPEDFDFCGQKPGYVLGMSVPPFMMQRVALELAKVLLTCR